MKKILLSSLVILLLSVMVFSEDESPNTDLLQKTMKADIETASFFELKNWAERLGLDYRGNKEELIKRLLSHYGIEYSRKSAKNTSIVITSADKLESIHIDEADQDYIVLSGKIKLEITDKEKNTLQTLKADKVVFNRKEKTVSAEGSIVYIIEKDKSKEYFYGDKLTFNVDNFEGLFFKGISEKHLEKDGEEKVFYFFGEKIYRKKGDVIVLENGTIASSKRISPYYHISADKIWILNPGEWAMKGSVLYVGRIPVFAFPFIYMPGDKLVFHPVYGVKDKSGYFINTTTYLYGQPSTDDQISSFSFLQNTDSQSDTVLKREGLFLRKTTIPLNKENDSYLKLFADYYTQKLGFVGLKGSFSKLGVVQNLEFFAGAGINRYIFNDPVYGYSPFYTDTDGNFKSAYIKPYFFKNEFPFRFGFDLGLNASISDINISLKLPVYSDPGFYSDFMDRKEYFDFKKILSKDDITSKPGITAKNSLSWSIDSNWKLNETALQPFVTNLSVDRLRFDVSLLSRDLQYPDYTPADPVKFYYPQNIVYPDFSGKLSGEIFNTRKSTKKGNEQKDLGGVLKSPWKKENSAAEESKVKEPIQPPEISEYEKLPYRYTYTGLDQSLTYSVLPRLTLNAVLNSGVPADPVDVMTTPDYTMFTLQNSTALSYALDISDKLLNVDSKVVLNNNYKEHFGKSENYTGDWDALILQDKTYTNYSMTNTSSFQTFPLLFSENFSDSNLKYTINSVLINHTSDKDQYFSWDKNSITDHKLDISLVHKKRDFKAEFDAGLILPPLNNRITSSLSLDNEYLSTKVSTGLKENTSGIWSFDPVLVFGKYTAKGSYFSENLLLDFYDNNRLSTTELFLGMFDDIFSVKETFKSDIYNFRPITSITTVDLWNFTSSFVAERTEGFNFIPGTGWVSNLTEEFQPSKVSFGLNLNYSPDPVWKNRIKFNSDLSSAWSMNLLKPTDTNFTFNLSFDLIIEEFLDLKFKSESVNSAFYRYIPYAADKIGIEETVNPFLDLIKSFNFFNKRDRVNSNFNLQLLEVDAVHHLGDWDLNFAYQGKPEIYTNEDTTKEYRWTGSLSIFVEWKPIPEIRKEISFSDDELQF